METMKSDDSRSSMIRFAVKKGPLSKVRTVEEGEVEDANFQMDAVDGQDQILHLEAQGIIIYDRTVNEPSHVSLAFQSRTALANTCG